MINITQIFFLDDNDLSKNKLESSVSARHIIRSAIQNAKMRNDLYRYSSWRIQTAPLERKVIRRYKNYYVTSFTNGSWILIGNFIDYAVVFKNSHSIAQKLSTDSTIEALEEWWDYGYEDYLRDNTEEERKREERATRTNRDRGMFNRQRKKDSESNLRRRFSNLAKKIVLYEDKHDQDG